MSAWAKQRQGGGDLGALLNPLAGQLDDYNNNLPGAVCN